MTRQAFPIVIIIVVVICQKSNTYGIKQVGVRRL